MSKIPTEAELYDEFRDEVEGDEDHQLTDFSDGSALDGFAGVGMAVGRAVQRFAGRQVRRLFITTAKTTEDLQFVAFDRYRLQQLPGETDDEFKERIEAYIETLTRGTPEALYAWLTYFHRESVGSVDVVEDNATGITTLTITVFDDVDISELSDKLDSEKDEWRAHGDPLNIVILEP